MPEPKPTYDLENHLWELWKAAGLGKVKPDPDKDKWIIDDRIHGKMYATTPTRRDLLVFIINNMPGIFDLIEAAGGCAGSNFHCRTSESDFLGVQDAYFELAKKSKPEDGSYA